MSNEQIREKLAETLNQQKEFSRGKKDAKAGKTADVRNENTFYLEGWVAGL